MGDKMKHDDLKEAAWKCARKAQRRRKEPEVKLLVPLVVLVASEEPEIARDKEHLKNSTSAILM